MNSYEIFTQSVEKMMESSFLMAGKNLGQLLANFTAVNEFKLYLKTVLASFNYPLEFDRASVPLEMVGEALRIKLILPRQESIRFAFIVCLLTEIDAGRRDFVLFLNEYFNRGDTQKSYEAFCDEIILPFAELAHTVYKKMGGEAVEKPLKIEKQSISPREQCASEIRNDRSANLLQEDISAIEKTLNDIREVKSRYSESEKIELYNALSALSYAIYEQNAYYICVAFTGLRYTMRVSKIAESRIKLIHDILKKRGIINKVWNWR